MIILDLAMRKIPTLTQWLDCQLVLLLTLSASQIAAMTHQPQLSTYWLSYSNFQIMITFDLAERKIPALTHWPQLPACVDSVTPAPGLCSLLPKCWEKMLVMTHWPRPPAYTRAGRSSCFDSLSQLPAYTSAHTSGGQSTCFDLVAPTSCLYAFCLYFQLILAFTLSNFFLSAQYFDEHRKDLIPSVPSHEAS